MKILKQGNAKSITEYFAVCSGCDCEFSYVGDDVIPDGRMPHLICPTCKIWISAEFTPISEYINDGLNG